MLETSVLMHIGFAIPQKLTIRNSVYPYTYSFVSSSFFPNIAVRILTKIMIVDMSIFSYYRLNVTLQVRIVD